MTSRSAAIGALIVLCAACGPTPPPTDARDFEPSALPIGGPQPWDKGTRTATAVTTPTPTPLPPTSTPTPVPAPAPPVVPMTPGQLKAKILTVMREGMDQDLILAFVSRQKLEPAMTVDDILDWKRSGIADDVVKAAANR